MCKLVIEPQMLVCTWEQWSDCLFMPAKSIEIGNPPVHTYWTLSPFLLSGSGYSKMKTGMVSGVVWWNQLTKCRVNKWRADVSPIRLTKANKFAQFYPPIVSHSTINSSKRKMCHTPVQYAVASGFFAHKKTIRSLRTRDCSEQRSFIFIAKRKQK